MLIYAIDDEPLQLNNLCTAISAAMPDARTQSFTRPSPLLAAIEAAGEKPNVAFIDIELPGMDGLTLATRIKSLSPETNIVFVTGFSLHALEAYNMHASGYVVKPVSKEKILSEIENLRSAAAPHHKLRVQCFGKAALTLQPKGSISASW